MLIESAGPGVVFESPALIQDRVAMNRLVAAVEHIPPKGQQTIRYCGLYSNKRRGMDARAGRYRPKMREAAAPNPAGTASEPPPSFYQHLNRRAVARSAPSGAI